MAEILGENGRDAPIHAPPVDVVVVGAGPTGLLSALLLSRSGVSVRVLDKSPTAAKESRAFAIQARTVELFASLGLAERFLEAGTLAAGAQVYVDGERVAGFDFDDLGRDDTRFPMILLVPQSLTEAILVEELEREGIAVERGVEITALRQDGDGVLLKGRGRDGEIAVAASYAIGADGAHSVVRKALGLTFEGAAYPQTFLLADCRAEWRIAPKRFTMLLHRERFALVVPLRGSTLVRVIVTADATAGDAAVGSAGSAPLPLADVEAALREAAQTEVVLTDAVWTSRYRVHHRCVDRYGVGRVFVAGDAAHIHSPAGGQGMNTGLQDAHNLCWKLALAIRHGGPGDLLASYDGERRPVGENVLRYTDRVFSLATTRSGWVAAIRDRILPLFAATASRSGAVRSRAFHFVSQLGIGYGPSRFVAEDSEAWAGGPSPGKRAPDAAVSHAIRVHDLIGGYRFHLLAFSRTPLDEDGAARLSASLASFGEGAAVPVATHLVARSLIGRDPRFVQAERGDVFRAYGLEGDRSEALYLVRPDGHVAWRGRGIDVEAAGLFLRRFGDRLTA